MMESATEIIVAREDIDELGHVNNKMYVGYLEKARMDWYARVGLTIDAMRERNIGTVVLKLTITFLKEAVLNERLIVKTRPVRLGKTSYDFKQEIFNETGEKVTDALVTSVMFDLKRRKSMPVVSEIARQFEQ